MIIITKSFYLLVFTGKSLKVRDTEESGIFPRLNRLKSQTLVKDIIDNIGFLKAPLLAVW